jgi:hypothetical protein
MRETVSGNFFTLHGRSAGRIIDDVTLHRLFFSRIIDDVSLHRQSFDWIIGNRNSAYQSAV